MAFKFEPYCVFDKAYSSCAAYFCMEFAIHQPLKTYAGGLGFLAGSHMRSAFALKQNMIGIGILWKYGYYDQVRKQDQTMDVLFEEKMYGFLRATDIKFTVRVSAHDVMVTAYYLPPDVFGTAPLFFLSTDLPENDYLARTISHKLYDANPETKIAAAILLGAGGARLLELLKCEPQVYHLNESHGLPLAFYLYNKYKNINEVRKRLVFTNHTTEAAGNQKTNVALLSKMGFFCEVPLTAVSTLASINAGELDHTLTAFNVSWGANAVSRLHQQTLLALWKGQIESGHIKVITNAQDFTYWHDEIMYNALAEKQDELLVKRKKQNKRDLFEIVADQAGEIYDVHTCTIVFAKRFTGYKRADLLFHDMERFHRLVTSKKYPVQIIWAGKPYPMDYTGIGVFDKIVDVCKKYTNCAILCGYEMRLSKTLKKGADVWLNLPRMTHEASGTSGMTAAMNGAVNVSLPDGWFPEFAKDKINAFVIPACDPSLPAHEQDDRDADMLYQLLEQEVLPAYYDYPARWLEITRNSMQDIVPQFDTKRMAKQYYELLYTAQ